MAKHAPRRPFTIVSSFTLAPERIADATYRAINADFVLDRGRVEEFANDIVINPLDLRQSA
jgi:hypothetical protein